MAKVKVRRASREELPGIVVLRDSIMAEMPAFPASTGMLDLEMEVDPTLNHLITRDPDGFMTAVVRDETLGFAAAHVRARQCVISELWVLPQHRGQGAGEALLSRIVGYGDRSGAREYLAMVPVDGAVQSLLLRHGFKPICPVYTFTLTAGQTQKLAPALSRLLVGQNMTADLLNRKGQADLDRLDQLSRNITRKTDHDFWLKERHRQAAFVRQGDRIAAYGYGSAELVGPIAGATQDAALAALGWALQLAAESDRTASFDVRVPAPFTAAVDVLQETGALLVSTSLIYGHNLRLNFDRSVLATPSLP